ncbi:hypothetical protein NECAME_10314 [Necator americanus]|uniref:C-type lectin domain-containing protein n=1 Tax=Necator americanus TaxID=51031 RepID=W2T906_NECAM|nr:hypothetical protein NECAME_10314 [Necator americanus]ETN78495.1 hypothetical protein NECAME_10314 [Necator americanus]
MREQKQKGESLCSSKQLQQSSVLSDIELQCPEGWNRLSQKCFKTYHLEKSWPQALHTCSRSPYAHQNNCNNRQCSPILSCNVQKDGVDWVKNASKRITWRKAGHRRCTPVRGLVSQQQEDDAVFVWSDGIPASRYVGFWKDSEPDYKSGSCAMTIATSLTFIYDTEA